MAAKKLVNAREAIECLKNLDVCSEHDFSCNEDLSQWEDSFILPPNDKGD